MPIRLLFLMTGVAAGLCAQSDAAKRIDEIFETWNNGRVTGIKFVKR